MKHARSGSVARRAAAAAALASAVGLAVVGCGGCSSEPEFPPSLAFPARADRLVLKLPEKPPAGENTVYGRDAEIAALDSLGGKTLDPAAIPAESRAKLDAFLAETFGTPAAPKALSESLRLTEEHLAEGSRLYRRKCQQCHNLTGDGRGPSGATVPFPRDYRQGAFKFVTSGEAMKPRRADLLQTLHNGLKGTAMPSFSLLQEGERDLLAGYATYLAIRGQVEFEGLKALAEGKETDPAARVKEIVSEWEKAEAAPPLPKEPADGEPGSPTFGEAVRRGFALFTKKEENSCVSCHEDFGRKPVLRYDVWGTVAKPANLTEPHLKAGKESADLYARVRFGIAPVGMPAHPPAKYSDRDVWDLVRFVQSAPYRDRLPPEVRAAVYPNP